MLARAHAHTYAFQTTATAHNYSIHYNNSRVVVVIITEVNLFFPSLGRRFVQLGLLSSSLLLPLSDKTVIIIFT